MPRGLNSGSADVEPTIFHTSRYVNDQLAIDLDQKAFLAALSNVDFAAAKAIYELGGHSGSFALLTTTPLACSIQKDTVVTGSSSTGAPIKAIVSMTARRDDTSIAVFYSGTGPVGAPGVDGPRCRVGGLMISQVNISGCFIAGSIQISGGCNSGITVLNASQQNERTLSGLSTRARDEMLIPGELACTSGYCW